MTGPRFVGDVELAWPEGRLPGAPWHPDDVAPLSNRADWSLSALEGDHAFFTAYVLAASGVARDPVEVYWAERGLADADAPLLLDCGRVVFAGLPPPWDGAVFACRAPLAKGLFTFLDRFSVARPDGVWDSLAQVVPVVDWKLLGGVSVAPPDPPTVAVRAYGLGGPPGTFAWKVPVKRSELWTTPNRLTFLRRPKKPTT